MKKYIAEMLGTMVLVLMGCGTAVSLSCTSADPNLAATVIGTALAFGLSVVAMAYTCLLYTSPSPRDRHKSRMPSSA